MAKLEELFENEEFVAKMEATETEEDMQALMNEYNVEIPDVKEGPEGELTEDDLQSVAGGMSVGGLVEAFKFVWDNGGGKAITAIINPKTIKAFYICSKANSDYNRGNMYRTYSEKTVRNAINTLDNALSKVPKWMLFNR